MTWTLATAACASTPTVTPAPARGRVIALVGGTIIDGNGGIPLPNATLVIVGDRITTIGPRAKTTIPPGAWQIDARGKYLTPGWIDANVHLTLMRDGRNSARDAFWKDSLRSRRDSLHAWTQQALAGARSYLQYGVTTIRDTYGHLPALLNARDSLQRGRALGARLLVAGNMIGLDGPTPEGMGRNLLTLDPDSLREVTERYFDKGIDFIKIAVTDHDDPAEEPILFSADALEVMVQVAHRRGKRVDAHATTPEGLRMAALAGIDVVQHPETPYGEDPIPSDVIRLLGAQRVICSIFPGWWSSAWIPKKMGGRAKEDAKALIRSGCRIAVATDETRVGDWGLTTIGAIEALVHEAELTPAEALTAATRTGAEAAGAAREYGTLEVGKRADVLVLGANPLEDIRNIRKLEMVLHQGYIIDSTGQELTSVGRGIAPFGEAP